jgi:AcrR family transcriptional regulator
MIVPTHRLAKQKCSLGGGYNLVRKTKEEALETRERILDAAIEVFFDKGVTGASLEEIAEQAGVTRGAIYWHFRNKLDLFEALHEQLHLSVIDKILNDLETDHPHPLQQLETLCIGLLSALEQDQRQRKILSVFFMKCDYSGDMAVILDRQNASKHKSIALFAQYFERAKRQQHLDVNADPHTIALALSFYLTGIVNDNLRDPSFTNMAQQAPRFMRQFFVGIPCSP